MHIWQILDGKPGHDNQSHGLIAALKRMANETDFDVQKIPAPAKLTGFKQWLLGRFPAGSNRPKPDLLLGAGHRTHAPMLAAQRRFGGKTIVLMKPSLPLSLFDCCLIPEHDQIKPRNRALITHGVLNPLQAEGPHDAKRCLLLIGGHSRHAKWDDQSIIKQLAAIIDSEPKTQFILTTSRRTPTSFIEALNALPQAHLEIHLAENTHCEWLAWQMSLASRAWVSTDSVSMIYEALTAGLAVGILELPTARNSRVIHGLNQLYAKQIVTTYTNWTKQLQPLTQPSVAFNEAERCAQAILNRWPELTDR